MRFVQLVVGFLIFSFTSIAFSSQMQPTREERLDDPIELMDQCSGVQIVEWRYTPGYSESTGPSKKSIRIINKVCNLSLKKFPEFVKNKGFVIKEPRKFETSISLIPYDKQPRSLNDLKFRFSERDIRYVVWGYTHRPSNFVYIRHDVLHKNERINHKFKTILAHELYHAMSYYYQVYHQYSDNSHISDEMDECLAQEFSEYLGLGR